MSSKFDELSFWSQPAFELTPKDEGFKESLKLYMLSCLAIPPNMEEFGEVCELIDETDCSDCDSVTDFFEKIIDKLKEGQHGNND
jgi:hypothetical protein